MPSCGLPEACSRFSPCGEGATLRNSSRRFSGSSTQLPGASKPNGYQGSENLSSASLSQNQSFPKRFFQASQGSFESSKKLHFSLGTRLSTSYVEASPGYFFLKSSSESAR